MFAPYDQIDYPPSHPGAVLRNEVLPRLPMGAEALAKHLRVKRELLLAVLAERRAVTVDLAQRLGAALGTGARYWLALQVQYDVWHAEREHPLEIAPVPLRRAGASANPAQIRR